MASERTYVKADVAPFRFVRDEYGVLSNFAPMPVEYGGIVAPTSEHVYQAMKFEFKSEAWYEVMRAGSPKEAKTVARSRKMAYSDKQWQTQRLVAMRTTLKLKFEQNEAVLRPLLERSGCRAIVEESKWDAFWGAKPEGPRLRGVNALGRLWMELRRDVFSPDVK